DLVKDKMSISIPVRHTGINALGESISIFVGVILLKQVGSLIKESSVSKDGESVNLQCNSES
ncbi:hypothetical protein MEO93_25595, partial [Dolichospermum sp. ST_sed3]|nr:hypothetical protein [Dolichospermum sp. ST_sed3]